MVQVTLCTTVTTGVRRVVTVVAGVLIAVGFAELIGLTWWSLALIVLASLVIGHFIRVDAFVAEVAISAMLVLAVPAPPVRLWTACWRRSSGPSSGTCRTWSYRPPPSWSRPVTRCASRPSTCGR